MVNLLIILLILGVVAFIVYRAYKNNSDILANIDIESDMEDEDGYDIESLKNRVSKVISQMLKEDLKTRNLSKEELDAERRRIADLRKKVKESAYGDMKAKADIKNLIIQILSDDSSGFALNASNIEKVIPFNTPESLKDDIKFEIVVYIAVNKYRNPENKLYGKEGFAKVIKNYNVLVPHEENGELIYELNSEKLNEIFFDLINKYELTYNDKCNILAQKIFEKYKGFGVADVLFSTSVDDIAGGLSGTSRDGYEIESDADNLTYTYQAIWVMVSGIKLRLTCIGFDSQEELVRVTTNIYKYGATKVLSRMTGWVVSTMKNGSRISVMRPPFANTYAFIARKFDSTKSVAPEFLIKGNNAEIPMTILKWLIKGEKNLAITGGQGTGKSTMLKSLIRFINPTYALRVQELAAELNLNYTYPNRNILSFQETDHITSQHAIDFSKKTSADVTIIGECAEAIQANYVIQAGTVASKFVWFTHHAKTSSDLVIAISNNLLDPNVGIYRDKKEAVEMVSKVLNVDMHLENRMGHRFTERLTEIIPITDHLYPTDKDKSLTAEDNTLEFYKRQTDRDLFTTRDLVVYDNGEFVLKNLPSDRLIEEIKRNLTYTEQKQFDKDMEFIKNLPRKPLDYDVFNQAAEILDPDLIEKGPVA